MTGANNHLDFKMSVDFIALHFFNDVCEHSLNTHSGGALPEREKMERRSSANNYM